MSNNVNVPPIVVDATGQEPDQSSSGGVNAPVITVDGAGQQPDQSSSGGLNVPTVTVGATAADTPYCTTEQVPSSFDTKMAGLAGRLIRKYGRCVSLVKWDRDPADSDKPWREPGNTPSIIFEVSCVMIPYDEQDITGQEIRAGDIKAFIAHDSNFQYKPEEFDTLFDRIAGSWRIVSVRVYNPGVGRIMYELQLRQ